MAKANILQVFNKIQENLGEQKSTSLASLSGMNLFIFNTINEALYEIGLDYKYSFLEHDFQFALATGTSTYTHSGSVGMFDFDRADGSFNYNNEKVIPFYTWQKFNREIKVRTDTGVPRLVYHKAGYFRPYPIPSVTENGKVISFSGWRNISQVTTATETATTDLPEGFETTLLADYSTYKVLHYRGNPEWQMYYTKVYGSADRKIEGSLNALKRIHGTNNLNEESIMAEPINDNSGGDFVQSAIEG